MPEEPAEVRGRLAGAGRLVDLVLELGVEREEERFRMGGPDVVGELDQEFVGGALGHGPPGQSLRPPVQEQIRFRPVSSTRRISPLVGNMTAWPRW